MTRKSACDVLSHFSAIDEGEALSTCLDPGRGILITECAEATLIIYRTLLTDGVLLDTIVASAEHVGGAHRGPEAMHPDVGLVGFTHSFDTFHSGVALALIVAYVTSVPGLSGVDDLVSLTELDVIDQSRIVEVTDLTMSVRAWRLGDLPQLLLMS